MHSTKQKHHLDRLLHEVVALEVLEINVDLLDVGEDLLDIVLVGVAAVASRASSLALVALEGVVGANSLLTAAVVGAPIVLLELAGGVLLGRELAGDTRVQEAVDALFEVLIAC